MTRRTSIQLSVLMFVLGLPSSLPGQLAPTATEVGDVPLRLGPPTFWPDLPTSRGLLAPTAPASKKPSDPAGGPGDGKASLRYWVYALEFKDTAARKRFEALHWPKVSAFDQFLEVFVEREDLPKFKEQARSFKDLVWMDEVTDAVTPPPSTQVPSLSRGLPRKPEAIVRGGHRGLTGKGVIVAIVDTGVDFRNPDFITLDAKGRPVSRLLYLWDIRSQSFDQGKGGSRPPMAYPNGTSMGTLYTQAQLTAELRASKPSIATTDRDGHGTMCAGVAAGNGRNGPGRQEVRGVAPDADLIAVCVGPAFPFILNPVVDWLDKLCGTRPLVISHSMGGQWGGHDGLLVHERALSARFHSEARGRALVISAGNEGNNDSHAVLDLHADGSAKTLAWKIPKEGTSLRLYVDVTSPDQLRMVNRNGQAVDSSRVSWSPYRGTGQILIQGALKSDGQITFSSASGRRIHVDAYLGERQGKADGAFTTAVVREALVGTPGTTDHAITVGAYMWNEQFDYQGKVCTLKDACTDAPLRIGDVSCYSSPGFSRSGEVKPDLIAPADFFTACRAKTPEGEAVDSEQFADTSGNYVPFNGTSAATPYVAGVIALLFQKNPRLDLGTLRALLATHVTRDGFTGKTPNLSWGHGKLDLAAIDRLIDAVR